MKSFFTNLKQRYNIRDYKISLVFLVTLISLVGILMVRSARPDLMNRQIMGVCLGLIVMFIISFKKKKRKRKSRILYASRLNSALLMKRSYIYNE